MRGFVHLHVPPHEDRFVGDAATVVKSEPVQGVTVASIPAHTPFTPDKSDGIQAIITRSDGFDHIALQACKEAGVAVYHLGDYAADAVADHTMTLMASLAARLPEALRRTRAGSWDRQGLHPRRLQELTVGVVGTGAIGSRVVRRLQQAGVSVVGHDIAPDELGIEYLDLGDVLDAADIVTLHVPLDDTTRHLIDGDAVARLGGKFLVNTSRGAVVDEQAVAQAMRDGRLAGYAADVIAGEPDPAALELFRDCPNTLITPHIAAYDEATIARRYKLTEEIAKAILAGEADPVRQYRVA